MLALKWADVRFASGEIILSRGIVRQQIGTMKTEASRKPVPLDAGLGDVLTGWRGICPYNQDGDYLFASPDMDGHQVCREIRAYSRSIASCRRSSE